MRTTLTLRRYGRRRTTRTLLRRTNRTYNFGRRLAKVLNHQAGFRRVSVTRLAIICRASTAFIPSANSSTSRSKDVPGYIRLRSRCVLSKPMLGRGINGSVSVSTRTVLLTSYVRVLHFCTGSRAIIRHSSTLVRTILSAPNR